MRDRDGGSASSRLHFAPSGRTSPGRKCFCLCMCPQEVSQTVIELKAGVALHAASVSKRSCTRHCDVRIRRYTKALEDTNQFVGYGLIVP